MNIVTVHNLKKYFGKGENQVKALDGIDLEIEKGKFTAIIGWEACPMPLQTELTHRALLEMRP